MVVLILFHNFAGMKKLLHIFPALVLSLLIVAMSAGLSVEVCMHSGRAEVAQIAEAQGNHDCHGMKGCMVVKTIKLAPSSLALSHIHSSSYMRPAHTSPHGARLRGSTCIICVCSDFESSLTQAIYNKVYMATKERSIVYFAVNESFKGNHQ